MANQTHQYPVTVRWAGGRDGHGDFRMERSGLAADVATPEEFGGPGGAACPEELLATAVATCYNITLGIVAAHRKIPVTGIEAKVTGEVEQSGMSFVYSRITIEPTIRVPGDVSEEQMTLLGELAVKADHYCLITNTLRDKVEVVVRPVFEKE